MTQILFSLMTLPLLASPLDDGAAAELRYSGSLTQLDRKGGGTTVKRFNVYCLVTTNPVNKTRDLAFLVDERGGGSWAWPERYGVINLNGQNRPTNAKRIRLLHTHNDLANRVLVRQPVFEYAEKLAAKAKWTAGKYSYEVVRSKKIDERVCWEIDVSTNFGRRQTIWVEKQTPLVVQVEQRVFMGRGDQFSLKMELASARSIDAERLALLQKPLESLLALQTKLNRGDNVTKSELSRAQLNTASAATATLEDEADATPFARLAGVITRDVKSQLQRFDGVANLAKKFTGQPAPKLTLKSLTGSDIDPADHQGKIVLLHFWEYRDEPLVEPYGQVGYLDYLYGRRKKLGVNVYGIAVDSRLTDKAKTSSALRSIRKLRDFMNLSYPLTVDDGSLLKKFGDPRKLGAKLPLWVLISPDGKVVHYKAGFYKIKPDEGLKALDQLVIDEIKKARAQKGDG